MKLLAAFDLDGTLAPSKSPIDSQMSTLLGTLSTLMKVAIISGGALPQFEEQVLGRLPGTANLANMSMLPTCGTKFLAFDNGWKLIYSEDLSDAQKQKIEAALRAAVSETGLSFDRVWGEQIEDRGSQITFSALGQQAPLDAKKSWDPDFAKRKRIKALLDLSIPEFSVQLGGTTSVDVTLPGIDKAYGIRKMRDLLGISTAAMIYVGDALFPGGNDFPATTTGAACIAVRDPEDTKRVIETMIACAS
jgi:HAD superfamily hydrolase (TIGR01484 family)